VRDLTASNVVFINCAIISVEVDARTEELRAEEVPQQREGDAALEIG